MNLGEAITFVLRNRSQNLLQDFLREDLAGVVGGVIADGSKLFREGREGVKNIKLKNLPGDILSSAHEVGQLIRILPGRIHKGLTSFQNDMLTELDKLSDSKEKAIFCLKVFGVLTTSSFSTFYNLKNSGRSMSLGKIKIRSAFAQFLLGELVLRSIRLFAVRFLREVELKITAEDDLDHVRYFHRILTGEATGIPAALSPDDPAFRVTEKLKKIILNGDDES